MKVKWSPGAPRRTGSAGALGPTARRAWSRAHPARTGGVGERVGHPKRGWAPVAVDRPARAMPRAVVPCRPATLPYASSARLRLPRSSHGWPPQDKLGPGKTRHRGTGRQFLNHAGLASPIHPERVRMTCPQDGGRGAALARGARAAGRRRRVRRPGQGDRRPLRGDRLPDPARSPPSRGRRSGRVRGGLARHPLPPRRGPVRTLAAPPAHARVLRGGSPDAALRREHPGPAGRQRGHPRRGPHRPRPRRAGTGDGTDLRRPARRAGLPPLLRPHAARDRGATRDPDRHREVATPLRHLRVARGVDADARLATDPQERPA